jgi:hypothetical protein
MDMRVVSCCKMRIRSVVSNVSGIHIGGNTESVSMGRTDEANVGKPGVTPTDTGFFRVLIEARGMRLEA